MVKNLLITARTLPILSSLTLLAGHLSSFGAAADPFVVGAWPGFVRSRLFRFEIAGSLAYVAGRDGGLHIFDISNPNEPRHLGALDTLGSTAAVALHGSFAYLADAQTGIVIVNVADPSNPTLVGNFDTASSALNIAVAGPIAYVADFQGGFQVIDISSPAMPLRAGGLPIETTEALAVMGPYVLLGTTPNGVKVIDVSIPSSPQVRASVLVPQAQQITVVGNRAFVATLTGLSIIDLTNPLTPRILGSFNMQAAAFGVAVSGTYAYVAHDNTGDDQSGPAGLQILDVTNPAQPQSVGRFDTDIEANSVSITGKYAYVTDGNGKLYVLDIANPAQPQLAYSFVDQGTANDVAVAGTHAYLADYRGGLRIIDIGDLTTPVAVGQSLVLRDALSVAVRGMFAYVTGQASGLHVFDVSTPSNPVRTGFAEEGKGYGITLSGNHAYVAEGLSLEIINIANPASPQRTGFEILPMQVTGVAVAGPRAYLANRNGGQQTVDISDLNDPVRLSGYDSPGNAGDVIVSGSNLYLADGHLLRISSLTDLNLFGECLVPASFVAASSRYAYVTGLEATKNGVKNRFSVVDVANVRNPVRIASIDLPDRPFGIAIDGPYAFVATYQAGLTILGLPTETTLQPIGFNAAGAFQLRALGPVGYTGKIQRATQLNQWHDWQPITFTQAPITLTDPDAANSQTYFYRFTSG